MVVLPPRIASKDDYYNSRDQNKEIGNELELCILVGINPELSQFLNLQVDFLLKYTMFTLAINIFFKTDMFDSIQISSTGFQYKQ